MIYSIRDKRHRNIQSNISNHLYLDSYPNPNKTYSILGANI
jgi:hypothetical protein